MKPELSEQHTSIKSILAFVLFWGGLALAGLYFYFQVRSGGTDFHWSDHLYVAPMLFLFGAWLRTKLLEKHFPNLKILLPDLVVALLSGLRFFTELPPYSGHVLFLSYTLLTSKDLLYRILASLMLCYTLWLKFGWNDWQTPLWALMLTVPLWWWRRHSLTTANTSTSTPKAR